jgi:hypothetical protein
MTEKKPTGSRDRKEIKVTVQVNLLERTPDAETKGATVYAFTPGGRMISRASLGKDGVATLPVPIPGEATPVHVIAGPKSEIDGPGMSELLRRGGVRQVVRLDPEITQAEAVIDVIRDDWLCWFLSRCHVPGQLTKRVELDGMSVDLPVCGARIEVYEVDPIPLIVARLPDSVIDRLRQAVLEPDPRPLDIHLPERRRLPVPRPPRPDLGASIALNAEMDAPRDFAPDRSGPELHSIDMPVDLQMAARTASSVQFRDVLAKAPDLSRFLICRYFPGGVSKQLVAAATTDECGRFRAVFHRGCKNPDTPDLYFEAKRVFGPFTITLLAPTPVVCYTHWNYACGTEVKLVTSHALAPTCEPCQPIEAPEDDWVAFMHIGNLPLSRIRGASPDGGVQAGTTAANMGMVFLTPAEAAAAATFDGRPMGGLLRPHLEFDSGLRSKGIRYYQFSWRKGTSGAFQPLTHEVHRHYSFEVPGSSEPVFQVYPLGPFEIGGKSLFEIPPALPPSGIWVYPDLVENHSNAKFPTQVHAPPAEAGKYQLKLDLFDAAGNLVDIDAPVTRAIFVVPEEFDLSLPATVHTENAESLGLVQDDDGDGKKSFILTLHVDNTACEAAIEPAELTSPANACGVLQYSPDSMSATVSMPFTALHENGHATYQFTLKRGVTGLSAQTIGGSDPLLHPRANPPGSYQQTATVGTLTQAYPALGLPECEVAAFSEHVRVWAMATNGWRRLSEYDALDHGAFVLSPSP